MQLARALGPRRPHLMRWLPFGWLALLGLLVGTTAVAGDTVDRVRQTGALKLGYLEDAPPFSYLDESGKPTGYAVVLCEKVADAVKQELGMPGLRTDLVKVEFAQRFDAVKQGTVDLLCAAGTVTLSRREQADFSIPIFPAGIGALMRKDAPERMRAILAGKPEPKRPLWRASLGQVLKKRVFAVRTGTLTETWLEQKIGEFNIIAKIDPVTDDTAGVEAVVKRRADVLFGERSILLDAMHRNPAADDLLVLERQFTYDPFAMAMKRGADDFRLLVDRSLSRIYRSDEIDDIYSRFLGAPSEQMQVFFLHNALPE